MNCHSCGFPLEGATVELKFSGLETLSLNGLSLICHARCIRLQPTDRNIPLPERIPDPIAEPTPEIVTVEQWGSDWYAICAEHGAVAIKGERDDAHLLAAVHIDRVHVGQDDYLSATPGERSDLDAADVIQRGAFR